MANEVLRCGCTFTSDWKLLLTPCVDHEGFSERTALGLEITRMRDDLMATQNELLARKSESLE